ncbi:protein prenyltransferase alpha subunit repeat-containing protein 1-A-like [Dreissena polymorpha]|uniref:Protein prenyltransferase alpha subunit repeat-containing protein 1 n=1 Tax=Dreissena polymorpha TaxID=45954 RepID=A0A9D4I3T1_DREPO|nr:protein prenyltransferase alpha subunit repeat-containing protein 1-A-like [Dreissena polymorpha]KAH3741506.1 hypothetical protein DPMN_048231 [Dreissena polymorpha]
MGSTDKRGRRLFLDLNNAFKRDNRIDEFDYIPVMEPQTNCSPVVLVNHKLGIEMWSLKILLQFAYHSLMEWRATSKKFIESQEIICLSRAVVLLNPECSTAWNIRKEYVESGELTMAEDLKLSALVLTKHPKSSETFCHRRWLLSRFIDIYLQSSQGSNLSTGSGQEGFVSMDAIDLNMDLPQVNPPPVQNGVHVDGPMDYQNQMKTEIHVCTCAAEKYPCNYYAWSQRIWLIQHAYNCSSQALVGELHRTEGWVSAHISDTCGYHYRQFLLSSLCRQRESLSQQLSLQYTDLLEKEQGYIVDLIGTFPGHEAMWCHRRFVFNSLYRHYSQDLSPGSPDRGLIGESATQRQKKTRLEFEPSEWAQKEEESVKTKELKSLSSAQKQLAQKYLDWMRKIVIK